MNSVGEYDDNIVAHVTVESNLLQAYLVDSLEQQPTDATQVAQIVETPTTKHRYLLYTAIVFLIIMLTVMGVTLAIVLIQPTAAPTISTQSTESKSTTCLENNTILRESVIAYLDYDAPVRNKYRMNIGDWCR
jgi:hypothetical protein